MMILTIKEAQACIEQGGVIAYPTEAVYGLGCDPLDKAAVMKLLALKSRAVNKGLILISDQFESLRPYINMSAVTDDQLKAALDTWPGPFTWIFPVSDLVPTWIKGDFDSVALRVIEHPVATPLCQGLKTPLVSTSANLAGLMPAREISEVLDQFPDTLDGILEGRVDISRAPSEIRDVRTGAAIRL